MRYGARAIMRTATHVVSVSIGGGHVCQSGLHLELRHSPVHVVVVPAGLEGVKMVRLGGEERERPISTIPGEEVNRNVERVAGLDGSHDHRFGLLLLGI